MYALFGSVLYVFYPRGYFLVLREIRCCLDIWFCPQSEHQKRIERFFRKNVYAFGTHFVDQTGCADNNLYCKASSEQPSDYKFPCKYTWEKENVLNGTKLRKNMCCVHLPLASDLSLKDCMLHSAFRCVKDG